jgi:CSLREA domain-containing protein
MSRRNRRFAGRGLAAALVGIVATLTAVGAQATTYTVGSTRDASGDAGCSLRDAINAANGDPSSRACNATSTGDDTINFRVTGEIILTSALPQVADANLKIDGPIRPPGITIDGNKTFRVFEVASGANLAINNLTVANGQAAESVGGAILVESVHGSGGEVTVTNCTFWKNGAQEGGAIALATSTSATVINSTFTGNNASAPPGATTFGGAISNEGTLFVINSTFEGNSADNGDGIATFTKASTELKGTILARNSGGNCFQFPISTVTDDGYNIDDDGSCGFSASGSKSNFTTLSTYLGPLANNGGPTMTIAELPNAGNPTIDAIPFADCTYPSRTLNPCTNPPSITPSSQLTCDQRGEPRPDPADGADGNCDIGAYEFQESVQSCEECQRQGDTCNGAAESNFYTCLGNCNNRNFYCYTACNEGYSDARAACQSALYECTQKCSAM